MMSIRRLAPLALTTVTLVFLASEAAAGDDECVGDFPVPLECFPDVLCPQFAPYWDFRRAVVHIAGPDFLGTGVLINNGGCANPDSSDSDCGTPYLLTAYHVVSTTDADQLTNGDKYAIEEEATFSFGLEAVACDSPLVTWEVAVGGASVVAQSKPKDLLLLRLDTKLPTEVGAYFVGWGAESHDQVLAISHPCGGVKKIAVSDPWSVTYQEIVGRDILAVESWEQGALVSGSSGAPLIERSSGVLLGIYSQRSTSVTIACNGYQSPYEDIFTAISSVLEFLPPSVTLGQVPLDAYDSNAYMPIMDTATNNEYYGPGTVVDITANQQVFLTDGFHAAEGSTIVVEVNP